MNNTTEQNLKEAVKLALEKIKAKKESDLCRYLPNEDGNYIHHFTYNKLKNNNPQRCLSLIEEFIINTPLPKKLDPKPRTPRGLNQKNPHLQFPNDMLNRIIQIAREAKDEKLLSRLIGTKPLNQIKRELIKSIRENKLEVWLWESYKEAILATQEKS